MQSHIMSMLLATASLTLPLTSYSLIIFFPNFFHIASFNFIEDTATASMRWLELQQQLMYKKSRGFMDITEKSWSRGIKREHERRRKKTM